MEKIMTDGISIITVVLNSKILIEETILSVINQKNVPIQYIIIDGGSTDGTLEIIEKYKNSISIIISEPDGGIYPAINKGISYCNYPLVGLIHSGDKYKPDALFKVYHAFNETHADVIYGDIEVKQKNGVEFIFLHQVADHKLLKKRMSIFHPSTFVKLSVYQNFGMYNCEYRLASDYDFLLKLFLKKYRFVRVPIVLATFLSGGFSDQNYKLLHKENYQIHKKQFGVINAISYKFNTIAFYLFFTFRKALVISIIGKNKYITLKKKKYNKPSKLITNGEIK
jgi:glycosyltransferase involved in cell wall biosynthesis